MKENVNYYSHRKENLCSYVSLILNLLCLKLTLSIVKFTVILCTETNEDIEIQNFINKCWINLHA